jgi:hypothetical protein
LVAFVPAGCTDRKSGPGGTTATAKRVYGRREFEALVKGKTKPQVIDLLGKPEAGSGGSPEGWMYKEVTRDPVTGKIDSSAWVWFDRAGIADHASY